MKLMYSDHARRRMSLRFISKREVLETLEFGEYEYEGGNKFLIEYNRVVIVVGEVKGKLVVITVYHSKSFRKEIRRYRRRNRSTMRATVRYLKEAV